jgi:hypothetical protein
VPLSPDPDARAVQLANLKRGGNPAPAGNGYRLVHGGRSERLVADVEREVAELADALGETAPVRDADGAVPAADVAALEVAARRLKRYRHLSAWCDAHGRLDERTGEVKPAARYELEAEAALTRSLDSLGMTPASRVRLLGSATRAFDLAQAMAAQTEREGG